MFTTARAILALLNLINAVLSIAKAKQLMNAGEAETVAAELRRSADALTAGNAARDAARSRNASVPAGVSLPDDGFRRD